MGKDRFFNIPDVLPQRWSVGLFVLGCVLLGAMEVANGQTPREVKLSEVPKPPQQLEQLIAGGDVSFEVGPRAASSGSRIIGETQYDISYQYKSQAKWNLLPAQQGARVVLINVRFSRVQWKTTHVIWLRHEPATEGFWSDSILLHELDHVRLSNDPRVAKRFPELLKKHTVIRHPLQPGEIAGRELTDQLVEREVRLVFEELTDLIAIRYRELDRETMHGQRPLPQNSKLRDLLRPESPEAKPDPDNAEAVGR